MIKKITQSLRESIYKRRVTLNSMHINIDVELHYQQKTHGKKKIKKIPLQYVFSECYIRKIDDNLYQAILTSFHNRFRILI